MTATGREQRADCIADRVLEAAREMLLAGWQATTVDVPEPGEEITIARGTA